MYKSTTEDEREKPEILIEATKTSTQQNTPAANRA